MRRSGGVFAVGGCCRESSLIVFSALRQGRDRLRRGRSEDLNKPSNGLLKLSCTVTAVMFEAAQVTSIYFSSQPAVPLPGPAPFSSISRPLLGDLQDVQKNLSHTQLHLRAGATRQGISPL
ncbi:unnamed protein product [Pleuronectes platessa]|uniref:Uncharacterized protein n=1 Tax=Pleuronectes platessa TaxID=8262 RepID=A0A9N7YNX7_PLEPL|nr:unnamed protein product [Pleuronectes platessa]